MLPCVFAVNEKFLSAINISAGYHTTLSRKLTRIYRMHNRMHNMSALNIARSSQHSEDSMISRKKMGRQSIFRVLLRRQGFNVPSSVSILPCGDLGGSSLHS